MRLRNGTEHEMVSTNGAPQYQVSTFVESELPLTDRHPGRYAHRPQRHAHSRHEQPRALRAHQGSRRQTLPDRTAQAVRLSRRPAWFLMLIGIPLGISSRRGGKSTGFVVTIALVFIYYFLSLTPALRSRARARFPSSPESGRPTFSSPSSACCCCGRWRSGEGQPARTSRPWSADSRAHSFCAREASRPASEEARNRPTSADAFRSFSTTMSCASS